MTPVIADAVEAHIAAVTRLARAQDAWREAAEVNASRATLAELKGALMHEVQTRVALEDAIAVFARGP